MIVSFSRDRLVAALREWREEWDRTPHQFLIAEAFRQSDPQAYAEQVADHLLAKLLSRDAGQVAAQGGVQ